jgi:formate C-acetyltransferase
VAAQLRAPDDRLLVPCEPFAVSLTRAADGVWSATSLILDHNHHCGLRLQVSVLDRRALSAAQREPDQHRDLIVRIGGYSECFTQLDRPLQDTVIARTEHGL